MLDLIINSECYRIAFYEILALVLLFVSCRIERYYNNKYGKEDREK